MIWFWLAIAALACGATASLVLPLLRSPREPGNAGVSTDEARRLAIYRDRRAEIETERLAGRLSDADAAQAQEELLDEAAILLPENLLQGQTAPARSLKSPLAIGLAALLALALPLSAIFVYALIGAPAIVGMDAAELRGETSERSLNRAIADLRKQVEKSPRDGQAWAMLGQAQRMANDIAAARISLEKAIALLPDDARVIADYAEILVIGQGGDFSGKPVELLERAIKLDPQDEKAIAMMAAAQYRAGNLERALGYMRALVARLDPSSHEAQRLAEVITRIEGELGQGKPGRATAAGANATDADQATSKPDTTGVQTATAAASTVSGSITIDESLRSQVPAGATLFVLARGTDGSRVPLAAIRLGAGTWPQTFELSDAQAMSPQRLISGSTGLTVEARVSLSGNAIRQSGDLLGVSPTITPGVRNVRVHIDQRVP